MYCVILKITQVPRHTTIHPKLTAYCIHCAGRFYPTFYGLVNKVYGLANGSQIRACMHIIIRFTGLRYSISCQLQFTYSVEIYHGSKVKLGTRYDTRGCTREIKELSTCRGLMYEKRTDHRYVVHLVCAWYVHGTLGTGVCACDKIMACCNGTRGL
jgi:hypothetical protein